MPVVWTGARGIELSALSQGPDTLNYARQLLFELGGQFPKNAANNWSNNGIAGTVSPDDGSAWIAWTCHNHGGDTCSPDAHANAKINIYNPWWGGHVTCPNWSVVNPSITYRRGMLWVAWAELKPVVRRGPSRPFIHVASVRPF
jgi:hypothetical protein